MIESCLGATIVLLRTSSGRQFFWGREKVGGLLSDFTKCTFCFSQCFYTQVLWELLYTVHNVFTHNFCEILLFTMFSHTIFVRYYTLFTMFFNTQFLLRTVCLTSSILYTIFVTHYTQFWLSLHNLFDFNLKSLKQLSALRC